MSRNIKLTIAYDGTDFSGWQRQEGRRTVQGCIEDALKKIHHKEITLYGAGRTDSGVHARAQNANFYTTIDTINARAFVPALNSILPQDLRIRAADEVDYNFNARFSAKRRVYRYFFILGMNNLPYETRFALQLRSAPDILLLNEYTRFLRGELDCTLFASPSDPIFASGSGSAFRNIENAVFFIDGSRLVFEICANAFFRRMVRSIAGTLLYYEAKKLDALDFKNLLKNGRRSDAGPTLAPHGLFLWNVTY
ncbi:MAG: tRNA pseudouridine(38-40) synthase TruA [Termitinemataceae bacterium]|nr:MAG: tRNA pseudouridine(38-40) synthase TruA [Termitinemataceae bacterium]